MKASSFDFRQQIKKWAYKRLMPIYRFHFPIQAFRRLQHNYNRANPFGNRSFEEYQGESKYTLGIIKEFCHYHQSYIAACREMKVSHIVIDISGPDWIDAVRNSECDAFLVWPSAITTVRKHLFDERLLIMVRDLKKIIFPTYDELWMWESKRRMRDWLVANNVPTPRTWIFYDYDDAQSFIDTATLPLVFKTDHGDCSRGVRIIRKKRQAANFLRKAFTTGLNMSAIHPCDVHWGNVIFQEYMPDATEWRLIRVGDSYFGYMKKKVGDYASGSHAGVYADIPRPLLNFIRELTNKHNFMSMSMDVMVNPDGSPYVIEMQSVFGCTHDPRKLRVNGIAGRYVYNESSNNWIFEEGIFDQNICSNLRIEYLLNDLARR